MGNYRQGSIEHLSWYPGHMKKTRELISSNLRLVDAVVEVVDARIPFSSSNPSICEIAEGKPRIVVLNKADLADAGENSRWADKLKGSVYRAVPAECTGGAGINPLLRVFDELQEERNREKSFKRKIRLMVVGVPNVGKSSLINRLAGKKSAKTGNRPGVTRGKQWLTLENGIQLLDTPGILWPKFDDPKVGLNLAFCGSIKDEAMDTETLGLELVRFLLENYRGMLAARYKIDLDYNASCSTAEDQNTGEALEVMERIALKRGFIFSGKRIDYTRTANTLLDEFRSGKIGRITLEKVTSSVDEV